MFKLNKKELEAINRLLQDADFQIFVNALGNYAESLNERLVMQKLDTGDLHNLQGQTMNMVLLMKAVTSAPSELKKLAQPKT